MPQGSSPCCLADYDRRASLGAGKESARLFRAGRLSRMKTKSDVRLSLGLSLIALVTLMAEVLLIRVFEVIFLTNIGYAVITCAMFGFGLAGTYAAIWPLGNGDNLRKRLAILALLFGAAILLLRPALNATTLIYHAASLPKELRILIGGSTVYGLVLVPFFSPGSC